MTRKHGKILRISIICILVPLWIYVGMYAWPRSQCITKVEEIGLPYAWEWYSGCVVLQDDTWISITNYVAK